MRKRTHMTDAHRFRNRAQAGRLLAKQLKAYARLQHPHAAAADRTDGELGLVGQAELAHQQQIELQAERRRHRVAHRHAAARQG